MDRWRPWLLLAPALIVVGGLLLWPLVRVVLFSLQDYGLREIVSGETNYNGFENYAEVLGSPTLWRVVLPNTVGFAVLAVFGTVVLGTLVALLLQSLGRFWRPVVASAIMAAWAMPAVTGTYVWVWIFDADRGIVNQLLIGAGLMDEPYNWFTSRWSFYAIVLLNVIHHGFPFVAVTVLAGLLGVPKETLEAASLDGANAWRRFWNITVPQLSQVFAVVIILSTIWDFKVFSQVYLMPGGGGTNREVLNLGVWSYVESFGQNRYGFGSAIAVLLTVLLLIVSVVYVRRLLKEDEL
ncbi:sugar ABC transporter permease [Microbacterium sp. zg.Y625]|uniref:carbohydrate ABC transporter permease n=1 Tax=Microbacterium jiangjiandongii TaxID=3049071 RepID=UPI00214B09C0|nr:MULTISPECIES: sugar ABC transporter permease [unclassified Microbacterium]MCR2793441.1 sugar ABC transporter permease [Microbacterium sp. zg.Y625]WIM25188.1 sugar ABC transporter permease [Microbacterium sp. zg-Y625]